ncbi:MAG: formate dehydrogenase accessory sulfurtransferase FdhD [Magnetospirillum sp.]|nr:formate dehydrogenase accessory sulfurtransferase FdhD [Magnetospirillum sp.]
MTTSCPVPEPGEEQAAEAGPRDCSRTVRGVSHRTLAVTEPVEWLLPEEEPVAVVYNRRSFAVMLASPADLEDFGLGFSLSEGIVAKASEVQELKVQRLDAGLSVQLSIPSVRAAALLGRRRALEGRSGCGVCGIESLEALRQPLASVQAPQVGAEAIARALEALNDHQPMRARNHSVHGAAWCDRQGNILLSREDVGRHTALDKLIGAMSRAGMDSGDGFAVLSSRCGFELVQKAARVGIGLLASVSAPTTMALSMARQAGMVLAVSARGKGVVLLDE